MYIYIYIYIHEASFGMSGEDWIDVSLVDGWTLPFRLELRGECSGGYGNKTADAKSAVDCSGLTLDRCPGSEDRTIVNNVDIDKSYRSLSLHIYIYRERDIVYLSIYLNI